MWNKLNDTQHKMDFYTQEEHNLKISEEASKFTVKLEKKDQIRYLDSFLKKRLLTIWENQRSLLKIASVLPSRFQKNIYQNIYNQLKPLLSSSFHEDFELPCTEFTFNGWLRYIKLIAQVLGKHRDATYWEELTTFFYRCSKLNIIDLFDE